MNIVRVLIGSGLFRFVSKEDDRTCEVVNTKTKEKWTGFIKNITSMGIYTVELIEKVGETGNR
jgi:hypothetical protein